MLLQRLGREPTPEEIAEELEKAEAKIFEKPVFGSEQMAEYLYELAQKEELKIELIGLCTDICVVSNALLLKAKGIRQRF